MKTIIKYICVVAFSSFVFSGCIFQKEKTNNTEKSDGTNVVFQTGFNDENYIWENFIITTNRIETIK